MWRWYQAGHNQHAWEFCDDAVSAQVAEDSAFHMTMLGVDTTHSPEEDYSKARYFGDFVIDIDCGAKGSTDEEAIDNAIKAATHSAQLVIEFFEARCNVNHLKIYASGKKGYHIQVPTKLMFSRKTPVKGLPTIYKKLAERIQVDTGAEGIDLKLYSGKRGHMVRVPNKQREDGAYKVQISPNELSTMYPAKYKDLCSGPRPALAEPSNLPINMRMVALLDEARSAAEHELGVRARQPDGLPDAMLEGFGIDTHPECIKRLLDSKKQSHTAQYHDMAMQLSVYLHVVQPPESEKNKLISALAEASHSSTYTTVETRRRHLEIQVLPYVGEKKFSCGAVKSCIEHKGCCTGCPVDAKIRDDITTLTRIIEDDEGYLASTDDGAGRRLTNFHIEIDELFVREEHAGHLTSTWTGGVFYVSQQGEPVARLELQKDVFSSAKEFTAAFDEVRNSRINVIDKDVRAIKDFLMASNIGKLGMRAVSTVGLRKLKYTPEGAEHPVEEMHWIEEGWCISAARMTGAVKLTRPVENCIKHEKRPIPRTFPPEHDQAMRMLLQVSDPKTVGFLLGWVGASQVKEHIFERVKEFPLLHLWGIAGSGKTSMAKLFSALGSANYQQSPKSAEIISAYPLKELAFTSTTIPRILDECNKSKMVAPKWNSVREVLKACYQQSAISTGGLRRDKGAFEGAGVKSFTERAVAPMIYLSTSQSDEAELWERSIEVQMNKFLHGDPVFLKNFEALNSSPEQWEHLFGLARVLMISALSMPEDQVYQNYLAWLEKMPKNLNQRTQKSYAYIFLGLEFVRNALAAVGGTAEMLQLFDAVRSETFEWVIENLPALHARKSRTEVDNYFEVLTQAIARLDHLGNPGLRKGVHYIRMGNTLYLDNSTAFGEYRSACRWLGRHAEFSNPGQVQSAIEGHAYYLGQELVPNPAGLPLMWLKFDIKLLEEKGNDFRRFEQS